MVRPSDSHLGYNHKLFKGLIGKQTTCTEKKDGMQVRCELKCSNAFSMSLYTHNDNVIVENATSADEVKTTQTEWRNTIVKYFRENFDKYVKAANDSGDMTIYFEGMLKQSPCKMGCRYDSNEFGKVYAFEVKNQLRVNSNTKKLFFDEYDIPTVPIWLEGLFGLELIDKACEIIEKNNIEGLIVQIGDQSFKLKAGICDESAWAEKLFASRLSGESKQIAERIIRMRRNTGGSISDEVDPSVLVDQLISKELTHGDWIERYKSEINRKQFVTDFVASVSMDDIPRPQFEKLARRRIIPMILERLRQ